MSRDPRSWLRRRGLSLNARGIADTAFFGPEAEFFIFDDVRWKVHMSGGRCQDRLRRSRMGIRRRIRGRQHGAPSGRQGRLFPVPPVDSSQDIRTAMCTRWRDGPEIEMHHHEVATAWPERNWRSVQYAGEEGRRTADLQILVHNVAHAYGKTATFMPKPLVGDNGSGMHVHQSSRRAARTCSTATRMRACRKWRSTTSAASSSMPAR